jgi:hypothetical protein
VFELIAEPMESLGISMGKEGKNSVHTAVEFFVDPERTTRVHGKFERSWFTKQ